MRLRSVGCGSCATTMSLETGSALKASTATTPNSPTRRGGLATVVVETSDRLTRSLSRIARADVTARGSATLFALLAHHVERRSREGLETSLRDRLPATLAESVGSGVDPFD